MKKIKPLEDFGKVEEARTPARVAFSYDVGDNLNKAYKIQQTMIEIQKQLTAMGDEITAFIAAYPSLNERSGKLLGWMKGNIDKMRQGLEETPKDEADRDSLIDNVKKLQNNLKELKKNELE
jgi:hypothetical protein